MDFINNLIATFGPIPTIIGFAIIALLFYSIFKGGKGGNGSGGSNHSGGTGTPTPPPSASA